MNKIEQQVLRLIGEDPASPDVFTDTSSGIAPIRDAINDGVAELAMVAGGHSTTFHVPLISGQALYRLRFARGYFAWVDSAWTVTQKRRLAQTTLQRLNATNPRWMVWSGTPDEYFQVGLDVIGVSPKPSATEDVIDLHVTMIPARYATDDEEVRVRDAYRHAVVNFAVSEYWASRGDANQAGEYYSLFLDSLGMSDEHSFSARERSPRASTEKLGDTTRESVR